MVCLVFTARTYARNFDWRDSIGLWTSAVDVCPGSARPHYNLAKELERIPGRLPEVIQDTLNLAQVSFKRSQITVAFKNALPPGAGPG